LILFEI
jgi:predicted TPR repeat methyltransferase